jgi:hypothetical protein
VKSAERREKGEDGLGLEIEGRREVRVRLGGGFGGKYAKNVASSIRLSDVVTDGEVGSSGIGLGMDMGDTNGDKVIRSE